MKIYKAKSDVEDVDMKKEIALSSFHFASVDILSNSLGKRNRKRKERRRKFKLCLYKCSSAFVVILLTNITSMSTMITLKLVCNEPGNLSNKISEEQSLQLPIDIKRGRHCNYCVTMFVNCAQRVCCCVFTFLSFRLVVFIDCVFFSILKDGSSSS